VGRRKVLAATTLGAGIIGVAIVVAGTQLSEIQLIILGALWGGMAFPLYSVAVALTNDHAQLGEYVQVSSGLLLMYGLGAVVGPLVASLVMSAAGPAGLYIFSGVVHLILFGFIVGRAFQRPPVPTEQQGDFSDAMESAYTASPALDRDNG
jgi:MFS family permease